MSFVPRSGSVVVVVVFDSFVLAVLSEIVPLLVVVTGPAIDLVNCFRFCLVSGAVMTSGSLAGLSIAVLTEFLGR